MPNTNDYFSSEEAAAEMKITVASLRQMVFKKKIESIRIGRSIFIPKKAVREYVERTSGKSKNDPTRTQK